MPAGKWCYGRISAGQDNEYVVSEYTRLVQICHPSLCPIYVVLVDEEDDLSSTERGDGGFGSTGV